MKLDAYLRPFVVFDPADRKHRELFGKYCESGSWGSCPYRFTLDEDHGNLTATLQRKLTEYYLAKEFKIEPKKTV